MRIILKPVGAALLIAVILLCVVTTVLATRRASIAAQTAPAPAPTAGSVLPIEIRNNPAASSGAGNTAGSGKLARDNGSFSNGGDLPDGWTASPWVGQGTAHVARDTAIYHSAPAPPPPGLRSRLASPSLPAASMPTS